MTGTVTERAGRCCLPLFMFGFSMNDGRNVLRSVFSYSLSDGHYIPAGCIYNLATALMNLLQGVQVGAKRRNDDNIVSRQILDLSLAVLTDEIFNPHCR